MAKGKGSSWYVSGKEGMAKSKQEDELMKQKRQQRKDMPWRFRLQSNEEHVKGTLLDNPIFFFREHNLQIGGQWSNFFTCVMDFDTCPLDTLGNPSYSCAGTIIDHREWEDNKGEVHKNQKRLIVFKGKAREKIVRMMESKGDLKYCVLEFSRGSGTTESSTGEDIEYVKKLSKDQLKIFIPKGESMKWLEPYEYEKILAPKSQEEMRKIAGTAAPVGSEEEEAETDKKSKKNGNKKGKPEKSVESIEDLI